MRYQVFEKNIVIFRQNQIGDKFYIILSGCVGVFIDMSIEAVSRKMKHVVDLHEGQSFGELALQ